MPVVYDFDGDVLVFKPSGVYPPDELYIAWDAAMADERCPPEPRVLLDVRHSRALQGRSVADLRKVTQFFLDRAVGRSRRVALLAEGALQYGIMRMAATWVSLDRATARVFTSQTDALDWLRLWEIRA